MKDTVKLDAYKVMTTNPQMKAELLRVAQNKKLPATQRLSEYLETKLTSKDIASFKLKTETKIPVVEKPLELPTAKAIPKELEPLATEARKYKSAEEFVKSQEKVFRTSEKAFDPKLAGRAGTFVSPSEFVAETFGGKVKETLFISPTAKVLKETQIPKRFKYFTGKDVQKLQTELADFAKKNGFDVIETSKIEKQIVNLDVLKTKSQLQDFYTQATKGVSQITKKLVRFGEKPPDVPKGWQALPTTKALGELSGGYVSPVIYKDIQQWIRTISKGEKAYRTGIGMWKWSKVIANPATHLRNMYCNVILADLGGLSPLRADIWIEALRDLSKKGRYYKELKANSSILWETYSKREVMDLLTALEKSGGTNMMAKMKNMTKHIVTKSGNLYQAEEQWSKMALYIAKRKAGWEPLKAAQHAESWLFNYREVPWLIDTLRGAQVGGWAGALLGAQYPFITFTYKVTPKLIEAAWKNPTALTKWMKMYRGIEQFADADTIERQRALLPEHMQEGMYLRLPFKDAYNRDQYLDLNFILPWGDIGEVGKTLTPNHPFWVMMYSLILNKHPLGWDIVKDGSTDAEARGSIVDYIYKAIMPSLAPEIPGAGIKGGYGYEKIAASMRGELDYMEKSRDIKMALLSSIAGIKTIPFDVEEAKERKESETNIKIRDVQSRIRNLYRLEQRNVIDHKEFIKRDKEYQADIKKLGGDKYTPSNNWLEDNKIKTNQPTGRWMRGLE